MIDATMAMRIGIVAVAATTGAVSAFVGIRRIRRIEAGGSPRTGIDPVVNLCVRGTAAVFLLALLGWVAAGHRPVEASDCLSEQESGMGTVCARGRAYGDANGACDTGTCVLAKNTQGDSEE